MGRFALVLAALFALASLTSGAKAASFDCAKARTKVEKLICADPQLSRQDSELAAAYGEALKAWDGQIAPYVKMSQRAWVRGRALTPPDLSGDGGFCEDDASRLTCLRQVHADRIAVLKSPGFRLSGVYARGPAFLRVVAKPTGVDFAFVMADAQATQGFTEDGKPIRIGPGQSAVTFPLIGQGPDACRLDAVFTADAVVLTQKGPCSGSRLGGRWTRDQTRDPEAELF
jgi:uncharacterized protein YecT (DUF1311 family)